VLNLAVAQLWKEAVPDSRWGFDFGMQAGDDTRLAVPDPAAGGQPIGGAEVLSYLHRASASYLFPVGNGLEVAGGLIGAHPGYRQPPL
jgi:hypothetical protein